MHPHGLDDDLDGIFDHTGPHLAGLLDARILLTGATGGVGRWALEALIWARDRRRGSGEVLVLTRRPAAFRAAVPHLANHPGITVVEGDARTYIPPPGALDYIIAGAAPTGTSDREVTSVIVEGTRRALELAAYHGSRLVLISSGAARAATTTYGMAKHTAEDEAAMSGVEHVVARLFGFVGPHVPLVRGPFADFVADALAGRPVRVAAGGTGLCSYLYAADLAAWLWAITAAGADGVAYDVGSPAAVTLAELAGAVARFGPDGRVVVDGARRGDDTDTAVPDTTAAEQLGLAAWTGLDAALARTWRWLGGSHAAAA